MGMSKKTKETLKQLFDESKGNENSRKAFFAFLKSSGNYNDFMAYLVEKQKGKNLDVTRKETTYAMIDEKCETQIGKAYFRQIISESDEQSVVLDCGIGFTSPMGAYGVPEALTFNDGKISIGFGEHTSDALSNLAVELKKQLLK